MANNTVKLTFEVGDNGTLRVVDEIGRKVEDLGKAADGVSTRATQAFTAVKAAAVATAAAIGTAAGATAYAVKGQIDQLDDITKLARNIGISTRELSGLSVTADLAGVSIEQLGRGVVFFSRKLEEARAGGKGADFFKALGIDISSARGTIDILGDFSDIIAGAADGARKTATVVEALGRGGVGMVTMLNSGSEAMRQQIREAEKLGMVFDNLHGQLAEEVNDDFSRLQLAVSGTVREIAVGLLPALEGSLDSLTDYIVANREAFAEDAVEGIVATGQAFIDLAAFIRDAAVAYNQFKSLGGSFQVPGNQDFDVIQRVIVAQFLGGRTPATVPDPMSAHSSEGDLAGLMSTLGRVRRENAYDDALRRAMAAIKSPALEGVASGAAAAKVEVDALAKSIEEDLLFTLGKIETGNVLGEYFADVAVEGETAAITVGDAIVNEMERAEGAVIRLGEIIPDALVSAVDNLIASGKFDLGRVFQATTQATLSRSLASVLEQSVAFPDINLSRIFSGRARATGAASAGMTVSGGSFGGGMSVDSSQGAFMTDAATGQPVFVSGGASLPAAAGGSGFNFAGMAGNALAFGGIAGGLTSMLGGGQEETLGVAAGAAAGAAIGTAIPVIGTAVGAAVGAAIGLIGGLFAGDDKPNKDQATRMALDEAFKSGGIFPTLALSKEPPAAFKYASGTASPAQIQRLIYAGGFGADDRLQNLLAAGTIRPAAQPSFMGGFSSEIEALGTLLGLEGSQVDEKVGRNLGIRADILGIGSEQFLREIRATAQSVGTLDEALKELNFSFLRNAIDGKDASFTQEQYNARLKGTINLLLEDLPPGVDAIALAFANLDQYVGATVVNIEDMIEAIEQASQVASGLQSGIRGAGTSAVSGLLTGQAGVAGGFRRAVLQSAVGALGENALNSIVGSGAFGELNKTLTAAVLKGDTAGIESALAIVPSAFDQVNAAVARFIPLFRELSEEIEAGTRTAADYMGQRSDVLALRDRIAMSGMTQSAQRSTIQARLSSRLADLAGLTDDGQIIGAEQGKLDKLLPLITGDAEALARIADTYTTGSRQGRDLRQLAQSALDTAASALEIAASSVTVGDMAVSTMTVDQIIVSANAAAAITVAGLNTPQGQQAGRQMVNG